MKWRAFEWLSVAGLALVAFVLRALRLDHAGLGHFDEGGYGLGALAFARGEAPDGFIAQQHFLSPPGYFGLAGMAMRRLGESDHALLAISVLFGALTAPLVFALVRERGSRGGALAAGILIAFSDFHIRFSRTGLTDVSFTFLALLALLLFVRGERTNRLSSYLMGGIVTGLAWLTKYHGWLVGFVVILAHGPRLRERAVQVRLFFAALLAVVLYWPWASYVQTQPGGYAALTAEQGKFLSDWTDYFGHLWLHVDSQRFFEGPLTWLGLGLALLVQTWIDERDKFTRSLLLVPAVVVFAMSLGTLPTLILLWLLAGRTLQGVAPAVRVWTGVFAVLTPLYHAYPRLLMPLACGLVMCVAPALGGAVRFGRRAPAFGLALALAALWFAGPANGRVVSSTQGPWSDTDGLRAIANELNEAQGTPATFVVFAEPALAFYLRTLGAQAVHVNSLESLEAELQRDEPLVLLGGHYFRLLGVAETLALDAPDSVLPWRGSDVRLLNDAEPWRAREWQAEDAQPHRIEVRRLPASE